ncbi:peptide MFS transporter [Novosphingobium sp. 9]|uniref:peptide MFS transporter n=1 Tax=Novosphingobium sp. 9 TaxID=2025349 RepID=UPI0021B5753B|nr:peptide MFS transporter [Novosphingobium sp. 9]
MKPMEMWNEGDWIGAIAAVALFVVLMVGGLIAARRSEEFAGHPRGLFVLFYAEMWERFSYYGMRALLILYLTKFWLFDDGHASLIYGGYTSLVYITPVLGGYLADRWLGQRKAVLFGGIVLALGHLAMAYEGLHGITDPATKQADPAINVFWLALALIIVGSGFLKANISVIVGQLYKITDIRRDSAYTIFYMGINTGSALGTILVGYLGETIGWSWGFGLAGIGMVLGMVIFAFGKPALRGNGEPPVPLAKAREWMLYGIGVASVGVIWLLIQYLDVIQTALIVCGIAMLAYTLFQAVFTLPYGGISEAPRGRVYTMAAGLTVLLISALALSTGRVESTIGYGGILAGIVIALYVCLVESRSIQHHPRDRLYAVIFLVLLNPIFWGLYEQAGGSLSLYTDKFVDRGGVPTSLFQSINPIYIVLFGPVFAGLWQWLARRGWEPSAPAKFGYALIQVGLGFLVFVWGAGTDNPAVMTSVVFVFLIYLLHTTGELCLSPVGLSAMTRLSPLHLGSFVMGAWFYMTAAGNFIAGKIGEATSGAGGEMSKAVTLHVYTRIGWVTIGIAVVVLALSPLVRRWMHLGTLGAGQPDEPPLGATEAGLEASEAGMHPVTKH